MSYDREPGDAQTVYENELNEKIARLADENEALRECVRAADAYLDSIQEIADPRYTVLSGEWNEKTAYFSARAKVTP